MSLIQCHKITIKNKFEGQPLSGGNCILELDGQKLRGVKSFSLDLQARDVAVVKIEMFAEVDIDSVEIGSLYVVLPKENEKCLEK